MGVSATFASRCPPRRRPPLAQKQSCHVEVQDHLLRESQLSRPPILKTRPLKSHSQYTVHKPLAATQGQMN